MFQLQLPRNCEGFQKSWNNDDKASAWAIETAYFDRPFKLTDEESMEWLWFEGGPANKNKAMWIGFWILKLSLE